MENFNHMKRNLIFSIKIEILTELTTIRVDSLDKMKILIITKQNQIVSEII